VAQLGARFHGMEEVIGSIPIRSTNNPFKIRQLDADTPWGYQHDLVSIGVNFAFLYSARIRRLFFRFDVSGGRSCGRFEEPGLQSSSMSEAIIFSASSEIPRM
jgi:hypothetical protein